MASCGFSAEKGIIRSGSVLLEAKISSGFVCLESLMETARASVASKLRDAIYCIAFELLHFFAQTLPNFLVFLPCRPLECSNTFSKNPVSPMA